METVQLYALLNNVNRQGTGKIPIEVVDTGSFVALGNAVISSTTNVEIFLNGITQMFTTDLIEGRTYSSLFGPLIKGDIEWGVIKRKLSADMPEVSSDDSVELLDGQSIDQYIISKPVVHESLFVSRTPYKIFITHQRAWLKEAFTSEGAMDAFLASVFLKIRNKLELCIENLTRGAVNNYAGIIGARQTVNLVTLYNAESGETVPTGLQAMHNPDFMRYATGVIKETIYNMASMSTLYNLAELERFSSASQLNLMLLSKFKTQLETVALYGAFNDEYVNLVSKYTVPYWQASGTQINDWTTMSTIDVSVRDLAGATQQRTIQNVIGCVFDIEALGAYRKFDEVATTPYNARGRYWNTYFYELQMWFNAIDENFVLFTLN